MTLRPVDPIRQHGAPYRAWAWLLSIRPVLWLSRHVGWTLDPLLLRLTRGRLGMGLVVRTAVLETRGARTGRAIPLLRLVPAQA